MIVAFVLIIIILLCAISSLVYVWVKDKNKSCNSNNVCTENCCRVNFPCVPGENDQEDNGPGPIINPPINETNKQKMVAFVEGWGEREQIGAPQNYTHAVLAFAVPYRYYGGLCSAYCTPWLAWWYDNEGEASSAAKTVANMKAKNCNLKVLVSMGGWSFNHFDWNHVGNDPNYPNVPSNGCGYICKPDNKYIDNPKEYVNKPGNEFGQAKYNCQPADPNNVRQPSSFCYGPEVDEEERREGRVGSTYKYVADRLIEIVESIGADGIDLDLEDTDALVDERAQYLIDFIIHITMYIKEKRPNFIMAQAPMNAYLITDKNLNPYFYNHAEVYVPMLKAIKNYIDFIFVQFYNTEPSDFTDPQNVIKAYQNIVIDVFDGDVSKVVVGMCSVSEPDSEGGFTCNNCRPGCSDSTSRVNNLVLPLQQAVNNNPYLYNKDYVGYGFWSTAGDQNGVFSTPIINTFNSSNTLGKNPCSGYFGNFNLKRLLKQ
jgi:Chitinase